MTKNKAGEFIYGNKINLMLKDIKDSLKIANVMAGVYFCGMMVLDIKDSFIMVYNKVMESYIDLMDLNSMKEIGKMELLMVKEFNYFKMDRFMKDVLKMINFTEQEHL